MEAGHLNAIAFWFDLHLDEEASITTAPTGIGLGGQILREELASPTMSTGSRAPGNPVRACGREALQRMGQAPEPAAAAAKEQAAFQPAEVRSAL